nr:rep protein [Cressdnaviricota sp.]
MKSNTPSVLAPAAAAASAPAAAIPRQACRWCFTVNNPLSAIVPDDEWTKRVQIAVWQREAGEKENTPHYQGYIVMKRQYRARIVTIQRLLSSCGVNRAHCEVSRGSNAQAIAYCTKTDTRIEGPWYFPDADTVLAYKDVHSGTRTDISEVADKIKSGAKMSSIADEYPEMYIRLNRGFRALAAALPASERTVYTICIQSPPGVGKTTWANRAFTGDIFRLHTVDKGYWADGYDGEHVLLIDDYNGQIPIHQFNELLDPWPLLMPIKGGFVQARYTLVIILCNSTPDLWYPKAAYDPLVIDAVYRRIGFGSYVDKDRAHTYVAITTRDQLPVGDTLASLKAAWGFSAPVSDPELAEPPSKKHVTESEDDTEEPAPAPAPAPAPVHKRKKHTGVRYFIDSEAEADDDEVDDDEAEN